MPTVEKILMSKGPDVIVVSPETTVFDAVVLMKEAGVGATIICQDDQIKGIFTERDLLKRVVAESVSPEKSEICDVMTTPVASVSPQTPAKVCLDMMLTGNYRNLAVTQKGVLVGQVSLPGVLSACEIAQYVHQQSLLQE